MTALPGASTNPRLGEAHLSYFFLIRLSILFFMIRIFAVAAFFSVSAFADEAVDVWDKDPEVHLCSWLVAGPFPNERKAPALDRLDADEPNAAPAASATWKFFDDRYFTRGYDS
jgi:hypothetical protein